MKRSLRVFSRRESVYWLVTFAMAVLLLLLLARRLFGL